MKWLLYYPAVHWGLVAVTFVAVTWIAWWLGRGRRQQEPAQPVAHRLSPPEPWQEMERQNRWLAECNRQLTKERDGFERRCRVAHREGELETLDWCIREAAFHDSPESLVKAVLRRRRDGSL